MNEAGICLTCKANPLAADDLSLHNHIGARKSFPSIGSAQASNDEKTCSLCFMLPRTWLAQIQAVSDDVTQFLPLVLSHQ